MNHDFIVGNSALIISIPHAGTGLAENMQKRLGEPAKALPDTDWHVDRLYEFAAQREISLLVARYSRYVVDLNRPADDAPLYPGAGTGLVPLETFAGEPLYRSGSEPDAVEVERRRQRYWQPYHDALARCLEQTRNRHGYAVLLDAHSIASRVPRLFEGRLPDLNLGSYDGRSAGPSLKQAVIDVLGGSDRFSFVHDGRFKGGHITRHYGRPADGWHALQLEIAQAAYLDESRPQDWDPARARPLVDLLEQLVDVMSQWRPA